MNQIVVFILALIIGYGIGYADWSGRLDDAEHQLDLMRESHGDDCPPHGIRRPHTNGRCR